MSFVRHVVMFSILCMTTFLWALRSSGWMRGQMFQHKFTYTFRRLIRRKMPDAGQHLEAIGGGDEIDRAFGGGAADGVVGVAPDIKCRHANGTERPADRAAGTIPGERCFHRILVAEHGEMHLDRVRRDAI